MIAVSAAAQFHIEPIAGYQLDMNNKEHKFSMINSAIQLCWKASQHYEFILQFQKSWPVTKTLSDSSFTLNPALPVYTNAIKKIDPSSWSLAIGHRFIVTSPKSNNILSILLYTGFANQKIAVAYQYDKNNYTILNPDQTQQRSGVFISGGIEYMRQLKTGRLFLQATIGTMPSGGKIPPYSSFDFITPLSFNVGYSVPVKKNKHEKK